MGSSKYGGLEKNLGNSGKLTNSMKGGEKSDLRSKIYEKVGRGTFEEKEGGNAPLCRRDKNPQKGRPYPRSASKRTAVFRKENGS